MQLENAYFIGGSPCAGKSTAARALREKYSLSSYDLDAHLEAYMLEGARAGDPTLKSAVGLSPDATWLCAPDIQCARERAIYRAILPLALRDIRAMNGASVLCEGAGFLPLLMRASGIAPDHYVCVTPARDFQLSRYARREWVKDVLSGCTDAKSAFINWMERDCLFAAAARKEALQAGYAALETNDGSTPALTLRQIEVVFGLNLAI